MLLTLPIYRCYDGPAFTDGDHKVKKIGLTGGIGTGKTEIARMLGNLGANVISADDMAHRTYAPDTEGWSRVVREFGRDVLTPEGCIDRERLGRRVFSDGALLERLNAIVHPLTRDLIEEQLTKFEDADEQIVVIEAALLMQVVRVDKKWNSLVDEIWLVISDESLILDRLVLRRGLELTEIKERIESQMNVDKHLIYADVVIENNETLDDLKNTVIALWDKVTVKN